MQTLFFLQEKTMEKIKKVDIHDKVFEETYTAHIRSNGTSWLGWIPEVPKVKCKAPNYRAGKWYDLETLKKTS